MHPTNLLAGGLPAHVMVRLLRYQVDGLKTYNFEGH